MSTPIFTIQGADSQRTFSGEAMQEQDHWWFDSNHVQATKPQLHDYLQVEMGWSQALQEEGVNRRCIPAQNKQERWQVWLEAQHIWTMRLTQKLAWAWLVPFTVIHWVSPYADELELPMSIQIHSVQPVWCLDPVINDPLICQHMEPPPPVKVDGEEEYQLLSIAENRIYQTKLHYHLRSTGYN